MIKAMSNSVTKQILFLCMLCFIIISCNNKTKKNVLYRSISQSKSSSKVYLSVYKKATDSIEFWIKHNLEGVKMQENSNWHLDEILCFNQQCNKCVMAILNQQSKTVSNSINVFYGIFIKKEWYFFYGATCYTTPYNDKGIQNFAKLHEIAMKEVFNGYLIKKKKDAGWWKNLVTPEYEYEINDQFFKNLNIPLVPFSERKTNPNCPFSCRVIDNEKEYAECLLKKQALSIWNEECAFIKNDTYLYAPELPIGEKVISKINKGESFKVLEYIDNTEWVYVRMSAHNPNLGLIHRKEISKSKI